MRQNAWAGVPPCSVLHATQTPLHRGRSMVRIRKPGTCTPISCAALEALTLPCWSLPVCSRPRRLPRCQEWVELAGQEPRGERRGRQEYQKAKQRAEGIVSEVHFPWAVEHVVVLGGGRATLPAASVELLRPVVAGAHGSRERRVRIREEPAVGGFEQPRRLRPRGHEEEV